MTIQTIFQWYDQLFLKTNNNVINIQEELQEARGSENTSTTEETLPAYHRIDPSVLKILDYKVIPLLLWTP